MSARVLVLSTREAKETPDEAWVVALQTIPRFAALKTALLSIGQYRAVAFTSAAGVESFLGALMAIGLDARSLYGVKLAAVGSATARHLEAHQLRPDLVSSGGARELAEEMVRQEISGPVLFPRAVGGRPELVEALTAAGVRVEVIDAYESILDEPAIDRALDRHAEAPFAAIAFSSPRIVEAFLRRVDARPAGRAVLDGVRIGAIGETTRDALAAASVSVAAMPDEPSLGALVHALKIEAP